MSEKFNFNAELNGVKYDNPEKFIEDLKKASAGCGVKSISYHYSSVSGQEPEKCNRDLKKTPETTENKRTKLNPTKDTIERVSIIKEIIEDVAGISDSISESDEFGNSKLISIRDMLRSSIDKIKYLISGMQTEDRKDFCERCLEGMKRLYDEADSEYRDLIYEEAKYRQMISDENDDIEKNISDLKKEIDSLKHDQEENNTEIEWSVNRCTASEDLRDFFGDLIRTLEIK